MRVQGPQSTVQSPEFRGRSPSGTDAGPRAEDSGLREAAQGLESVFLRMLLKSMRQTVKKSGLFHGGRGEEMFTSVFDAHLADGISRRGLGLADMIVRRYAKHVEAGRAQDAPGPGTLLDLREAR